MPSEVQPEAPTVYVLTQGDTTTVYVGEDVTKPEQTLILPTQSFWQIMAHITKHER